jgi:Cd2+/Zn2+-exporting ATPase
VQQADGNWRSNRNSRRLRSAPVVRVKPGERIALDGESSAAVRPLIRHRSPAKACRWTRPSATRCLPARSTRPVRSTIASPLRRTTRRWRGSSTPSSSAGCAKLRRSVSSISSRASIRRSCSFSRWPWPIMPPLFDGRRAGSTGSTSALVLLVIACPCALVISTPVTIVSGLAAAARKGILVKGGVYLGKAVSNSTRLALDKTGTITHGKPVQTEFEIPPRSTADVAHLVIGERWRGAPIIPYRWRLALLWIKGFEALPTCRRLRSASRDAVCAARSTASLTGFGNHRLVEESGAAARVARRKTGRARETGQIVVMLVLARTPARAVRGGRHGEGDEPRGHRRIAALG